MWPYISYLAYPDRTPSIRLPLRDFHILLGGWQGSFFSCSPYYNILPSLFVVVVRHHILYVKICILTHTHMHTSDIVCGELNNMTATILNSRPCFVLPPVCFDRFSIDGDDKPHQKKSGTQKVNFSQIKLRLLLYVAAAAPHLLYIGGGDDDCHYNTYIRRYRYSQPDRHTVECHTRRPPPTPLMHFMRTIFILLLGRMHDHQIRVNVQLAVYSVKWETATDTLCMQISTEIPEPWNITHWILAAAKE